jgi:ComF family protein
VKGEEILCLNCLADFPRNNYVNFVENPVADVFIGRARIEFGTSYCQFDKGGKVQHLIHQLKYRGRREIGMRMGFLFGSDLFETEEFRDIDAILPVPLHRRKERLRGYNQSAEIAKGISQAMNKPLLKKNLIRTKHTSSQTAKDRYERWENVRGIFQVRNPNVLTNKHLLLVDDVITTGATLEACCETLLKIEGVKVSIATLANA